MRDSLVDDLDEFLEAYSSSPDTEAVANYLIEQLETYAEDAGVDDIVQRLEESGELDTTLGEALETEMSSNDEFEYTGEEIVSLLERSCGIEWTDSEEDEEDAGAKEEEEEEEDEEEEEMD